jgi:hypothetical protein
VEVAVDACVVVWVTVWVAVSVCVAVEVTVEVLVTGGRVTDVEVEVVDVELDSQRVVP